MDRIQFDIACQIIDLDCTGTGELKDGEGNFCVIGGLYAAIDPDWAVATDTESDTQEQQHYDEVAEVFGIKITSVFLTNDANKNLDSRRIAVKAELTRQLEEE